jgi:hypothetical protein
MLPALVAASLLLVVAVPPAGQSGAAALFDQGVSWTSFLERVNAREELWRTNADRDRIGPDLLARARAAADGIRILVVAEAACSDSVNTIPFIANLAARAGIDLRIVGRDAGKAVIERYRTPDGRSATPTVVLLRGDREVGAWVERPAALQSWYLAMKDLDTRERVDRKMSWYEWDRGDSTVAELVALLEQAHTTRTHGAH